jgi:hypothetical protein
MFKLRRDVEDALRTFYAAGSIMTVQYQDLDEALWWYRRRPDPHYLDWFLWKVERFLTFQDRYAADELADTALVNLDR